MNSMRIFSKIVAILSVILVISASDKLPEKEELKIAFIAEKDIEFDKGSRIESILVTDEKINDLKLLGMVWGFLKYYHPNTSTGDYNWDYELFRIMPKILQSKNAQDRDEILTNWIKSLGTFEVNDKIEKVNEKAIIKPDLEWITNSNLTQDLAVQLKKVKNAQRKDDNYYIGLFEGVGNPDFKNESAYSEMKYPDVGFRMLSLYRYWNNIQYFYPYKNLIEEDWKGVLKEFIPKFINASTEIDYKLTSLELIARIHDTHANIWSQDKALMKYQGLNYAPFEIKFIEEKAVVTDYYDQELGKKSGLKVGDVITTIDKKPVEEIILKRLKYTPASNYPTQLRIIAGELLRTNDTIVNIEFTRDGRSAFKKVKTYSTNEINIYKNYQRKDSCFKFISHDIAYLYLGTIKNNYLPEIMSKVQNTKGLIIDLRCYPSEFVVFNLGKYLVGDNTAFVKFSIGSIESPGLYTMTPNLSVGEKNNDYYKGKVVILVNETTQSQAEYSAMAFRTALKATVIGSTTAGADGNVSQFNLPGGISTAISGIGVYYPNGKGTQRIGIVPDIEIKPTIKGIIEGRDELIEKSVEIINEE